MPKPITGKQILELIEAQDYRCALTGRELTPQTASLDHKVPLSNGGTNELENVWIVHHKANTAKGTLSTQEFIELCREVAALWHGISFTTQVGECDSDLGTHPPLSGGS